MLTPKTDARLAALDAVYDLYDQFSEGLNIACGRSCDTCCTCNVTLTSLEASRILAGITEGERSILQTKLRRQRRQPRFIPTLTANRLADCCRLGEPPPEEAMDPAWGPCPLLENKECVIYRLRPFGCRCMSSTLRCRNGGEAVMDEFTFTVNHLFLQIIEHLDQAGYSGNLSDMLGYLLSTQTAPPHHLIRNAPARYLLIPPAHQTTIQPMIAALNAILQNQRS